MIRPYRKEDKEELLALMRHHIPRYFAASEESDFNRYLDHEAEDYFVVEESGQIIGSGGVNYFPEDRIARISWDFVHPEFQGKGVGKKLTQYRIEHIKNKAPVNTIVVRTSQMAYQFYQKLGFDLEKIEKDFWAKDYDLYQMKMNC